MAGDPEEAKNLAGKSPPAHSRSPSAYSSDVHRWTAENSGKRAKLIVGTVRGLKKAKNFSRVGSRRPDFRLGVLGV